uniref:Uncharacterized protein n=1 Tax=Romanomermis culicivorax TaxID=13658 RepID=A0A915KXD8_ROMCU
MDTIRTYNAQNDTNFALVGAYQVRRASVTSAVMEVSKDFEDAIATGQIDIGQNVRAYSGRTSFRNYHKAGTSLKSSSDPRLSTQTLN